jgi:hypothetical protein
MASRLLLGTCMLLILGLACDAGTPGGRQQGPKDPCHALLQHSTAHLQQVLEKRLKHGFPVTAQLAEGNARMAAPSIRGIDCEQLRVVVTGAYEFRGNLGVMDITRRGNAVLEFNVVPKPTERQVWIEAPEVQEVTFDNPAPWFDGKAINKWAPSLFPKPLCANLQNGRPC